jgi:hypothetical protein
VANDLQKSLRGQVVGSVLMNENGSNDIRLTKQHDKKRQQLENVGTGTNQSMYILMSSIKESRREQ